ncbi:MAG TPA: lytic transglycosylase domain-containing protein, partial [Polyangiaceae bacterium]|nr:lytic transglycosylase domain-containing protein [Polyangiaceae bacterium]
MKRDGRVFSACPIEVRGHQKRSGFVRFEAWQRALSGLGAAAIIGTSTLAHADIYRYTDSAGVIHFSNVSKKGQLVLRHSEPPPKATNSVRDATNEPTPAVYDGYIREAARLYQIPEALVRAVIRVESNFDPRAVSHANARGL